MDFTETLFIAHMPAFAQSPVLTKNWKQPFRLAQQPANLSSEISGHYRRTIVV